MLLRFPRVFAAALALLGCGRSGGDDDKADSPLLHGATAERRPVDVALAARDPSELLFAALLPHAAAAQRLGAHRFHGTHLTRVTDVARGKEPIQSLDEESSLSVDAAGNLSARYANSAGHGRELIRIGDSVWVRPLYGKYHHRAPTTPDEATRTADEIFGGLAADLELVGNAVRPEDGGAATAAGRPARRVRLTLGAGEARSPSPSPDKAWRATVQVTSLAGELVLDDATGAVLRGQLVAGLTFRRDGRAFAMRLESHHEVSDVGAEIAIATPSAEESAETPGRSPEFDELGDLLHGIAPPARRAATPRDALDNAKDGKK